MANRDATPAAPEGEPVLHLTPPDERLWEKYSPHFELPISGLLSVTLHVVGIVVVLAVVFNLFGIFAADTTPVPTEMVDAAFDVGTPEKGGNPAGDPGQKQEEAVKPEVPQQPQEPTPPKPDVTVPQVTVKPPEASTLPPDPTNETVVPDAAAEMNAISQKVQAALLAKIKADAGAGGKGGTGGPEEGRKVNERNSRQNLLFSSASDGVEWVRVLRLMGATIMIPRRDKMVDVFRSTAPASAPPTVEPLTAFERKYFQAADPESLESLRQGLGLRFTPAAIYVFLPDRVAQTMLRKELDYKGTPEELIESTQFTVFATGNSYDITVTEQRVKRHR